jgi:large subunit ribosomal protein L23
MELSIYSIIKGPVPTDKASRIVNKFKNKLVLEVHPDANKSQIAEALEKIFNVKVKNIRTIVRKGKRRVFKRHVSVGSLSKRAIVTLKEGYTVDLLTQSGMTSLPGEQSETVSKE